MHRRPALTNITEHTENLKSSTTDTVTSRHDPKGYLQIVLVVGLLIAGIVANAVLKRSDSPLAVRAVNTTGIGVVVVSPEIRDTSMRVVETGTVLARNSIEMTPQVGGRVVAVSPNLASGGHFKAGEILFRLEAADRQLAVDRALADRAAAEAELLIERAEAEVARHEWTVVYPDDPVPDLVARVPQIRRAEAALQSADAALADARLNQSRINYSLPFDGRILSTTIEVGQTLNAGQSYGRAYNTKDIEAYVPVTTDVLTGFDPVVGRTATVRALSDTRRNQIGYPAVVKRTEAELNPQTRLAQLVLTFDQPASLLPGEFIEAELAGPMIEDAHLIPDRAFNESGVVWVVEGDRLSPRYPKILFQLDKVMVTSAFDFADGVVISPLNNPSAGDAVEVLHSSEVAAGRL